MSRFTESISSRFIGTERKTEDITELEDLRRVAAEKGFEVKEKKPSLFARAVDVISRPLYASAGAAKAVIKKEDVFEEAKKGLYGIEKETYSDVLAETGIKNKYIRGGVGFALDVALDPLTYMGGAIFKTGFKTAKAVSKTGFKVVEKAAPESALHLEAAGRSLADAFGTAFKYGYKTTGGVADDVAIAMNRMGIAKEDIIANTSKLLGKQFTKKELVEAAEITYKNRLIELGVRTGTVTTPKWITSKSKNVNSAVGVIKERVKGISQKAGIKEADAYEYYYPGLKDTSRAKINQSTAALKLSRQDYLKAFKGKNEFKDLIQDPVEALSRVEFNVARDNIAKQSLKDMVETYGKSSKAFKTVDEALANGFKPIYEKGFKPLTIFKKEGEELARVGKAKKPIGYLKENDAKFIDNYFFPEMKAIDNLAKASGFDAFTRTFKTWVTAYFPAFHIRNMISGNVQNYQTLGAEALNPRNHNIGLAILKGANKKVNLGGKTYNTKELQGIFKENFRGASRYISDIGDYIEEIAGNNFKIKEIGKARSIGNFIEGWQKTTAMTASLRQGKTVKEAIKLAEKAGFDYTKITPFEAKIMRRAIPFYTFARKNAELQARTIAKNPERVLSQVKFADNLSTVFGGEKPTQEDLKGLPEWALNGLGFKLEGNKYLTKFGLPLEEFTERVARPTGTTLSSLNPLIKFPLESKMGYDFFREQKISDIRKMAPVTAQMIESDKSPQWLKDIFKVSEYQLEDGETRYNASPKALHILRNVPFSRLQNTLEKVYEEDMGKVEKALALLTGAKIYDIDIEQQKYFRERDLRRDIEDEMLINGVGREFNQFYIYK